MEIQLKLYGSSKILSDIPKIPEARMVGLSRVNVPIEVERLAFTLNSLILFSYNSWLSNYVVNFLMRTKGRYLLCIQPFLQS